MGEETKQEEAKPETKAEEKAAEEKKVEEKKEEEKKEEEAKPAPPPGPVILSVDLHCIGCAKKIERCLLKCKGVEEVEIDMGQNQLKIKGVVDPQALCSRLQKKTMRSAKVISPVLPPPDEADSTTTPQVVASQVSGVTSVELHVNMHCEACARQLGRKILKMGGVQTVETDLSSGKVTVTGTMTGDKIVRYIYRRTGKLAKVIPPPPPPSPPSKEEEKKEEGEKKTEDPKPAEEKKEEKPTEEEKKEGNPEKKEDEKPPEKKEDEKPPTDGKKEEGGQEEKKEGDLGQANMQCTGPDPDMFKRMVYWNDGGGYHSSNHVGEAGYDCFGRRMPVPWVPGVPAVYVIERPPPPPQLFSDENPNACCIS